MADTMNSQSGPRTRKIISSATAGAKFTAQSEAVKEGKPDAKRLPRKRQNSGHGITAQDLVHIPAVFPLTGRL